MNNQTKAPSPSSPEKPDHAAEPLLRSVRSTKILPRHLERSAIVYGIEVVRAKLQGASLPLPLANTS